MIIDAHAHIFPHHGGASGFKDIPTHLRAQQSTMANYWGRMLTNTLDPQYIPGPEEQVNFRVGQYGRYYWTKMGKEVWLQRFPPNMVEAEWTPEQMIAFMDFAGVEKAVLQALNDGYRTKDIMTEGMKQVGTIEMGKLIAERIEH